MDPAKLLVVVVIVVSDQPARPKSASWTCQSSSMKMFDYRSRLFSYIIKVIRGVNTYAP